MLIIRHTFIYQYEGSLYTAAHFRYTAESSDRQHATPEELMQTARFIGGVKEKGKLHHLNSGSKLFSVMSIEKRASAKFPVQSPKFCKIHSVVIVLVGAKIASELGPTFAITFR